MSNTYEFIFGFLVTYRDRPMRPETLERRLDEFQHEMLKREKGAVFDTTVGATLTTGEVEVELSVKSPSEQAAKTLAVNFIVDSLRAVGANPIGLFTFPGTDYEVPRNQVWRERKSELTHA